MLNEDRAKADLDNFITDLLWKCDCFDYILCFTHALNFRYAILPEYKSNRADMEPPKLLSILKDHMRDNHPWKSEKYLEADDLMGIYGTRYPNKYVLATIDKDFKSLPCTLFNWDKDSEPHRISEEEADFWFHYQWLTGDPSDGYKGVYRVGDKKARAILDAVEPFEWSKAVVETYADKCYSWKEIMQQCHMAKILRHQDYDFKRNEVRLWYPNC
jgi:DNA polymerase-1